MSDLTLKARLGQLRIAEHGDLVGFLPRATAQKGSRTERMSAMVLLTGLTKASAR